MSSENVVVASSGVGNEPAKAFAAGRGWFILVFCYVVALLWVVCGAPAQDQNPPTTLDELQQRLREHISQPKFAGALWGVKIVSLDTGKTLFEHNAGKLFSPASNCKLFTVALALERLGPDYRIKTSLYAKAKPDRAGTLRGDLIVYGRGDPTFNARLHNDDIYQALEPLVARLTNAGVKRIKGDLIGDESYFHGVPFGSGWVWDDLEYYYGAAVSALSLNDNIIQVAIKPGTAVGTPCQITLLPATALIVLSNRTETTAETVKRSINLYRPLNEGVIYALGKMPLDDKGYSEKVTMPRPAALFISFFREALVRHGIKVSGKLRAVNWLDRQVNALDCDRMVELGFVNSPPMKELTREVQKPSQNLYADLLLAHVGETARGADSPTEASSEELGISELNKFLAEAQVRTNEVWLEEGSGLSRDNLATPNAIVTLLEHMKHERYAEDYFQALPIAGVDGTLKSRMKDTPAAGNVQAKTGTLRWANSLSGCLTNAAGERLVFSIMLNRYNSAEPGQSTRAEIDTIPILLASFKGRTAD